MLTYGSFHFDGMVSQKEYILLSQGIHSIYFYFFTFIAAVRMLPEK